MNSLFNRKIGVSGRRGRPKKRIIRFVFEHFEPFRYAPMNHTIDALSAKLGTPPGTILFFIVGSSLFDRKETLP